MKDEPSPPPAPVVPSASENATAQAKALPSYYGPTGTKVYSGDPSVAGDFKMTETLSPEQQRIYEGKTQVAQALLDRSAGGLGSLAPTFNFTGDTDPATNKFFQQQKKLLDVSFDRDEERERQRLVNQGLPEGSEAYKQVMDEFGRRKADAYESAATRAITTGFDMSRNERLQNLNEIAQALGGQILPATTGSAGQPIDMASAMAQEQAGRNAAYQGQLAGYNAGVAGNNSMTSGLFSLGAAAIPKLFSDRRLKRDIVRVGELEPGVGWYAYHYVWDGRDAPLRHGVMADEIELFMPDAVIYDGSGYAMVDYGRLLAGRTVH